LHFQNPANFSDFAIPARSSTYSIIPAKLQFAQMTKMGSKIHLQPSPFRRKIGPLFVWDE